MTTQTIPIRIGSTKLKGCIIRSYPADHGNLFSLITPENNHYWVKNFYYENLNEWIKRSGQTDITVKFIQSEKPDRLLVEICDERIPREWYRINKA